jgi:hypothetical protein
MHLCADEARDAIPVPRERLPRGQGWSEIVGDVSIGIIVTAESGHREGRFPLDTS